MDSDQTKKLVRICMLLSTEEKMVLYKMLKDDIFWEPRQKTNNARTGVSSDYIQTEYEGKPDYEENILD